MGSDQKRALLAVVLSGIILFGWQYFFAPKTSIKTEKVTQITKADPMDSPNGDIVVNKGQKPVIKAEVSSFNLENRKASFLISSNLDILKANIEQSRLSFNEVFEKNSNKLQFAFGEKFENINFQVEKISSTEARLTSTNISGSIILADNGKLSISLSSSKPFNYRFNFDQRVEELSGGKLKQFVLLSDSLETVDVGSEDKGDLVVKWFGIDFNYHIFAIVLDKKTSLVYSTKEIEESNLSTHGTMKVTDVKKVSVLNYDLVYAKKEYDALSSLGDNLHLAVDFGIWSILATPILRGLQFLYGVFPNYGIAIILLTLLMRLLTFPLQYKSYKSMKKMQEVQPELAKIKERYKENPQKMQQETMALFKKAGANPLGGCLPMLLQMPIFFAFYRVLYNAVELVDAPFYFWITDLSSKDPYYVLPILMAVAMFFHQKLTPTTSMDPAQQKIMLFIPVIFAVFMKDFPAGLTLYIFVSTLAGMAQQLLVYRQK